MGYAHVRVHTTCTPGAPHADANTRADADTDTDTDTGCERFSTHRAVHGEMVAPRAQGRSNPTSAAG